ncbi:hypothetical protein A3860_39740 [Niastella vici]|uniref:NADAR domain-containing protein n=2 Tax=Niastella vici TaxID=1703345 RepID=A0A1V9FI34_9BACT|nr:hypothetical protein A3860_39740 [Niastella vici]
MKLHLSWTVSPIKQPSTGRWRKALLFGDTQSFNAILKAETPKNAKELGRKVVDFDVETWNAHHFDVVKYGNIHKFNQHPGLSH